MNRILFEPEEIHDGAVTFDGVRAAHVVEVLHGSAGQVLKTGVLGGKIGTSEIMAVRARGDAENPWEVSVRCAHDAESPRPWVDLVLAPPRPRALKRLLPQFASMGVGKIVLVGAEKVEKAFWGAQLLKPEIHRPLLVDGLMQAGTSFVPEIRCERNFRRYAESRLVDEFAGCDKVVGHPSGGRRAADGTRRTARGLVVAIGPEGGWTDGELALLESKGFRRRSLGRRILKTDTAAIALLAQLMETYDAEGPDFRN